MKLKIKLNIVTAKDSIREGINKRNIESDINILLNYRTVEGERFSFPEFTYESTTKNGTIIMK